ncbi:MAG: helix-turn-helix transcriptional regulator [Acidobacteriota bacterium]
MVNLTPTIRPPAQTLPGHRQRRDKHPCFGGVLRTEEADGTEEIELAGTAVGDPKDPTLQSVVRYILDAARHRGHLTEENRRDFDDGKLAFLSGQVFFEGGEISELRLEAVTADGQSRLSTAPPPSLSFPGETLDLAPDDLDRLHVSAFFSWTSEPVLAASWDVRGHRSTRVHLVRPEETRLRQGHASLPIPVNPPLTGTLRAIFAGGKTNHWEEDPYGRPHYRYETRDGVVIISFDTAPHTTDGAIAALLLAVRELSVETADVFLILMSKIAALPDPRGIASIRLEEIAELRSVKSRRGSFQRLLADFESEVLRLADLRLTMSWRDYSSGGTVTFGADRPDRLLDIVDWNYQSGGNSWTGFTFRSGQAMAHFLNPDSLRWVGYYSRALLELNPYQEALAKKIGAFWILIGMIAGKKGQYPRASMKAVLEFCGEAPNRRNPNRTVDALIEAHQRLLDIGLAERIPQLEPTHRRRGYFDDWLEATHEVRLTEDVWEVAKAPARAQLPQRSKIQPKPRSQASLPLGTPRSAEEIVAEPSHILAFRDRFGLRQADLAAELSIRRESLSRYERRLRPLPLELARAILDLWRSRSETGR